MKSIAKAILVGSFIVAAQAAVADGSTFPSSAGDVSFPVSGSTYADRHANDPVASTGSSFPSSADDVSFPGSGSTALASQPAQGENASAD